MNEMDFVDRIYLNDWPLILLNEWIERLVDENDLIRPEVCEAIDGNYTINQIITRQRFREILFEKMYCGGKLCKSNCNGTCATAGNIMRIPTLQRYSNFQPLKSQILSHFFFKLNDSISHCYVKHRIGILALYLNNNDNESEFIKKEKYLILNQLSNRFYITDYVLVDAEKIFTHTKNFIDCVVIIVDSHYKTGQLNDYYDVLKKFKFLKIFLIKTQDIAETPDSEIENYFQTKLPVNKIVVLNWLEQLENFTKNIKKQLPIGLRIKIAFHSRFIRK